MQREPQTTTTRQEGQTKLLAEKGKIMKIRKFESGPINAVFNKGYINADGDIGRLIVSCGNSLVELTFPQAVALANEILRNCQ